MEESFHVIIPARLASTRLEEKVLQDIAGKPMIAHVYDRAIASGAASVTIATDDKRIASVAQGFGAAVCMTASDHMSGSERLAEAVEALDFEDDDIVVGLQADEPLLPERCISAVAEDLAEHTNIKVATLCEPLTSVDALFSPDVMKVVLNQRSHAMYFSRAPIPWNRETFAERESVSLASGYFRHVGIYGYRVGFLKKYIDWGPCSLEQIEMAEQLRILWHGGRIHVRVLEKTVPQGVDTEADLIRVRAQIKKQSEKSRITA